MQLSKKFFSFGVATFLLTLASPTTKANLPNVSMQVDAIARIEHIIVGGQRKIEVEVAEAQVMRASSNQVQAAKAGMLLYANDLITTSGSVKLIIRSINVPKANESKAILYPNTQSRIINNTSYLFIFGRAWFGVKGSFSVRTYYWTLGARGTEFEVQGDKENSVTLAVLDGVMDVSLTDANKGRREQRRTPVPLTVKSLEEISLASPATPTARPRALTEAQVSSIIRLADEVTLASQPAEPIQRVFPHFESPLERSTVFPAARFNAIWHRQAAAFEVIGNVYSDWGEGTKALEAYNNALSLNPRLQNSARFLTNLAESYRLIEEIDNAEQLLTKALLINQYWAPALNALGNVYFAKATIAYRNKDLDAAKKLLQSANNAFELSFASVGRDDRAMKRRQNVDETLALGPQHSAFKVRSSTDIKRTGVFAPLSLSQGVGLESRTLKMASFDPFSSGPNFEGDSKFIWKEGGLIQASLPLNLRWQKNQDKQNQSRGVTKTNIGDTKTFLADIAREENKTEEAIQLYKAAEQAYREAKNFYPQYPYIARGLNRVSQTIRSLAPLKTPQPEKWVKLDVPIKKIPTQSVASSSAEALTAVVSYLIRSEVHACNMLNLVSNKDFNCCGPKNYLVCLTGPDPMQAVGKLERLYDLPVELEQSLSYMGIVSYIDKGLPVIAIFDDNSGYPPLVISGYGPSDMLVISTTSLERERTISYEQMLKMGWRKTVLVQRGKSVLIRGEAEEYAYAIVKMYLDKDFYRLAEQFSHNIPRQALLNRLMLAWDRIIRPAGPLRNSREPQVRRLNDSLEVSIVCHFQRAIVKIIILIDKRGQISDMLVYPN